jgi:hypothetical protein
MLPVYNFGATIDENILSEQKITGQTGVEGVLRKANVDYYRTIYTDHALATKLAK